MNAIIDTISSLWLNSGFAGLFAGLFAEEAVVREAAEELFTDDGFAMFICLGHIVVGQFMGDGKGGSAEEVFAGFERGGFGCGKAFVPGGGHMFHLR